MTSTHSIGKRVLVVEDDYHVATELAERLSESGWQVVGPVPDVESALEQLDSASDVMAAVLDVKLGSELVFPVADELERRGLPFVFATAFEPSALPARHVDKLLLRKPVEIEALDAALTKTTRPEMVEADEAAGNAILRKLSEHDLATVVPLLSKVHLPRSAVMEFQGQDITRVFFPLTSVGSLIAVGREGSRIETGLIGREGMTGFGLAIGDARTHFELVNQIEGYALAMAVDEFVSLSEDIPDLRLLANRFARSLSVQVSHTALSNARFEIRQRLARWLLMVDDRIPGRSFNLTHDYFALMLGVRRPSVTDAIHLLEGSGLIKSSRAHLQIKDREGLVALAGEAYGDPEEEWARLLEMPMTRSGLRGARIVSRTPTAFDGAGLNGPP